MNEREILSWILNRFAERGDAAYIGEPVSQTEHALQTAWSAEKAGADASLITAALLHDFGHLLHSFDEDCAEQGIDDRHEERGALWLQKHFGKRVAEPVRLHVPAKRYLCATEPDYWRSLSPTSHLSLRLQGGPFTPDEAKQFAASPFSADAITLRRWDETAKVPNLATPTLAHFLKHLEAALDH